MNGWTPDMVMRLPQSVHARLVHMLLDDDAANKPKSNTGFDLTTD